APLLGSIAGLGVDGTILAIFVSNSILTTLGLLFFRALYSASLNPRAALATLAAGAVSFLAAYGVPSFQSDLLALAAKIAVFSAVYLTLGPLLGAVDSGDLDLTQRAVGDMKVVSDVLAPFFSYQRLIARKSRRPDTTET
ncbi:MAG TPA: hypothetical protein VLY65_00680, partial [Nitrososphaerales archaeon]|nr:hypothetical protein [Nitrososphaerales archaeon]